uniref:Uncharacterized protein n=1 Tax=Babesia bovis TaxID=5865 RepID=S6BLT9_BABBO|nr:hypothetical protein [Babesia bovis]
MVKALFVVANLALLRHMLVGVVADPIDGEIPDTIVEDIEAVITVDDGDDLANVSGDKVTADPNEYIRDLRNALGGKGAIDPEKVYTAQAMLPVGEVLVLATASGCSLLNDPDGEVTGKVKALEFNFRVSELEECSKVTESLVSALQSQIAAEWSNLGGTSLPEEVASSTTLREIGMRTNGKSSAKDDDMNMSLTVQDMANAFLIANLEIKFIPTTAEGVAVMHFHIADNTSAKEISEMMSNIDMEKLKALNEAFKVANDKIANASPEELKQMEDELKAFYERNGDNVLNQDDESKSILEELSTEGMTGIECASLSLEDCASVSKCSVVKLNGKETCSVSPKTVFLLMETGCGLQSKAGLMSIVRDFVSNGLMSEATHQTLRQSFDLGQICNSIVHTYMSADIAETQHHESKPGLS